MSQGFIKTTKNNYLADSERGSFQFTEVGINFTKDLTDQLRVGLQLFARNLGPIGDYAAQFDWFYLDYRFADWLGIRVGRTKLPFGLYNETSDIDAARVPILLPQSTYPIEGRDFLLAQTGAELYGFVPLGSAGDLEYRVYGGTLFIDLAYEGVSAAVSKISTPYLFGGRLMWNTPVQGLQLGGSVQSLRLDLDYALPSTAVMAGAPPATTTAKVPATLAVASVEYSADALLVAAEYGRWTTEVESSLPMAATGTSVSERFYGMASYRVKPWLTPGVYYSGLFSHVDNRDAPGQFQHDIAGTLRFDLNAHWLLKLEGHFMHGTAALNSQLNGNAQLGTLERDWGLFLAKTTVYF